jgi:hypothetical protein
VGEPVPEHCMCICSPWDNLYDAASKVQVGQAELLVDTGGIFLRKGVLISDSNDRLLVKDLW